VLLVGALVAGIVFFATRNDDTTNTSSTTTPTATVTPSPSASPTDTPTETESPTPSSSGGDSEAPSDSAAQGAAEEFMGDLKDKLFNLAWIQLCDAGQKRFVNGAALQKELGLDKKSVGDYQISKVEPGVFNGDPRKEVSVKVTYTPKGGETLTLSVTQEHDEAKICGF